MSFRIEAGAQFLKLILFGIVTREDLGGLAAAARTADEGYPETPGRLVDLTAVDDFDITFSDVFARAKEREARATCPFKTAVLVASPVQRGFGRMYQAIVMHPKIAVEVFEDRQAAESWLAEGCGGAHSAAS